MLILWLSGVKHLCQHEWGKKTSFTYCYASWMFHCAERRAEKSVFSIICWRAKVFRVVVKSEACEFVRSPIFWKPLKFQEMWKWIRKKTQLYIKSQYIFRINSWRWLVILLFLWHPWNLSFNWTLKPGFNNNSKKVFCLFVFLLYVCRCFLVC